VHKGKKQDGRKTNKHRKKGRVKRRNEREIERWKMKENVNRNE
jgi:hypothetical protein